MKRFTPVILFGSLKICRGDVPRPRLEAGEWGDGFRITPWPCFPGAPASLQILSEQFTLSCLDQTPTGAAEVCWLIYMHGHPFPKGKFI